VITNRSSSWIMYCYIRIVKYNKMLRKPNIYYLLSFYSPFLTPQGPKAIFEPFFKFGQAIVKAIFIKNSWTFLWTCGLVLASRRTKFYKIPHFGLVVMSQNVLFFFSTRVAKKLFIIKFFWLKFFTLILI
jgi:hypothetical protein